jgi:hypothetical protein
MAMVALISTQSFCPGWCALVTRNLSAADDQQDIGCLTEKEGRDETPEW